jgi:hypothetical protein
MMPKKVDPSRIAVFSELPRDLHHKLRLVSVLWGINLREALLRVLQEALSDVQLPVDAQKKSN